MSMLPDGIIPIVEGEHGQIFDFVCDNGVFLITDYCCLDRDVWAENSVDVKLGEEKKRITITSIVALKDMLNKFVSATLEILSRHTPFDPTDPYTRPDFSGLKKDLLIEQLVFDVLFDKYLRGSKPMTRNGYSEHMARKLCPDTNVDYSHALEKRLTYGMGTYHDRIVYSRLSEQLEMLGADSEKYAKYFTPRMRKNPHSEKPKFIWDLLYYNFAPELISRQYRRQLTKSGRNYSYEQIIIDLKAYNDFITKLLPVEHESYKKYFHMSMDYCLLESYKRVDFIFRLIEVLDSDRLAAINKNHFLVSRFVPCVLVPLIQDGKLRFAWKYKYYRPLFMIEKMLLEESLLKTAQLKEALPQEEKAVIDSCERHYESLLKKYQHARAKTYELFKYNCVFLSNDYVEIKKFLCECYNMRSYHQSNTFWNFIQGSEWRKMDNKAKQQVMEQIRHFFSINNALFWKSSDRDYTKPKADN